uniref:Uncharacterized protein n=2 Tax=Meloidogyne TaxID=189290 RepID=A0A6V7W5Z8_MELEN|nr:unnamed protein product [Meloidogyne enterolobii]
MKKNLAKIGRLNWLKEEEKKGRFWCSAGIFNYKFNLNATIFIVYFTFYIGSNFNTTFTYN